MYKNILVPIMLDGSRDPETSLTAAKTLASDGARITLLNVLETIPAYVMEHLPQTVFDMNRAAAKEKLDALAKKLPNAHGVVVEGHAGPRILRFADENKSDCIVIASHEPGMSDFLLGSNAQKVVRHAHCAVHVLR